MKLHEKLYNFYTSINEAELSLSDIKFSKEFDILSLKINGKQYAYQFEKGEGNQLSDKFLSMMKHSAGKSLQWLKQNADLVSKPVKEPKHELGDIGGIFDVGDRT